MSMMNKNVMLKGADHKKHLPDFTDSTPEQFFQGDLQSLQYRL